MNAQNIVTRLSGAGHEAFIVGGAVRDALMGIAPKDEDVVTSARPEEISSLFRKEGISKVIIAIDGKGQDGAPPDLIATFWAEEGADRPCFVMGAIWDSEEAKYAYHS